MIGCRAGIGPDDDSRAVTALLSRSVDNQFLLSIVPDGTKLAILVNAPSKSPVEAGSMTITSKETPVFIPSQ